MNAQHKQHSSTPATQVRGMKVHIEYAHAIRAEREWKYGNWMGETPEQSPYSLASRRTKYSGLA